MEYLCILVLAIAMVISSRLQYKLNRSLIKEIQNLKERLDLHTITNSADNQILHILDKRISGLEKANIKNTQCYNSL